MPEDADLTSRVDSMMATEKIRIRPDRFLFMAQNGLFEPNVLILISDPGRFETAVQSDPLFENVCLKEVSANQDAGAEAENDVLHIHKGQLPGPIVTGRFTIEQFERLINWIA